MPGYHLELSLSLNEVLMKSALEIHVPDHLVNLMIKKFLILALINPHQLK
jgi:hypothetical protein